MRSTKVEKRVYPVQGSNKRILTGILLFLSCVLILSGLFRENNGGIILQTKVTPLPTALSKTFDETPATREIDLTAQSWYAIQLGAYDNEDAAKKQADGYSSRGAAGYVWKDIRYRVLAAVYPLKEDAQNVRQQLEDQHNIDSYVYEIALPEISIKVSGMIGQLDVLEAGLRYLSTAIGKFCEISVSMDKRDLDVQQQMNALAEVAQQADTLVQVLSQRFLSPRHAAVENLLVLLKKIVSAAKVVDENSAAGAVIVASQMKYQTLALLSDIQGYLSGFGS